MNSIKEKEMGKKQPDVCEDTIREMAYSLWEEAGKPEGNDGTEFWFKAEDYLSDTQNTQKPPSKSKNLVPELLDTVPSRIERLNRKDIPYTDGPFSLQKPENFIEAKDLDF